MPVIDFPEYAPDLIDIGTGVSPLISGVYPLGVGYGPVKGFTAFTQALPGTCRGYFFARKVDRSVAIFAATATNLYLLNNSDFSWTLVSKGGLSYSSVPDGDDWQFVQFEDTVIAVQINVPPQSFVLSSSTNFADLAGSPPQASRISVIGGFVVLNGINAQSKRIQWCDLFNITQWTAGVGLADFQDMADGGAVLGVGGGDFFGTIFQEDVIRRMIYVPGSAVVFDIVKIAQNETLLSPYSIINAGSRTFFCSGQGFRMVEAGGVPIPVGKERVDRTFLADVDMANLRLLKGSADPLSTRVYWAYKSIAGKAGLFDKMLCYDWSLGKRGRWSLIPLSGEFLATLSKPGITLENLDAIAPGALAVTGAANNGSGAIRLTLNAISNANFSLGTPGSPSQNFCEVQGVTGTTEANGSWAYSVIDATHIDLIGSTFVHAYVSGGAIGGSLDAMVISLDSISTVAIAQLGLMNSTHAAGFLDGENIEAILETAEAENDGEMSFISSVRPITDCSAGMVSIAYRNKAQDASTYSDETAIETFSGRAPQLVEARYIRGRLRCPAGSSWTVAKGLQPEAQGAGDF